MKKEERLVNKIKRLLRRLGYPRWLHHFGPKKYEFFHHLTALLVKCYCRLSYRRVWKLFNLLGLICPRKSALQETASKLPQSFWDNILRNTCPQTYLVALDSTGFPLRNPSYHYLRRIDGKTPAIPIKLSVAFDTYHKKFCAARARVLPAHDLRDAKVLVSKSEAKKIVADKGYSSEELHEFADSIGMILFVPPKRNIRRGVFRKKHFKQFRERTYHRREMVEAGFSSIKRKCGSSVSSKKARTIRSELYGRLACHNIFYWLFGLSGQSRCEG